MAQEPHGLYAIVHAYCARKPFAVEMRLRRETLFKVHGRVFAFMDSPRSPAVTVRVSRTARGALLRHPAVERARWIGWFGWVTVSMVDRESLDLAVALIDRSYELVTRGYPRAAG
jgi:predicted DNA-binding protein (MmcQ/YjbR family)